MNSWNLDFLANFRFFFSFSSSFLPSIIHCSLFSSFFLYSFFLFPFSSFCYISFHFFWPLLLFFFFLPHKDKKFETESNSKLFIALTFLFRFSPLFPFRSFISLSLFLLSFCLTSPSTRNLKRYQIPKFLSCFVMNRKISLKHPRWRRRKWRKQCIVSLTF